MRLLVSALEPSANIHLAMLKEYLPKSVEMEGIFSSELGDSLVDLRSLAVMGFVDAAKKLPFFLKLAKRMVKLAAKADKVLLMDSSGFNLPLAKKIKKRYPHKEIIYYILPQAWAWRKGRIKILEQHCDKLLSILPFEKRHYSPYAPIEYVGHPLLDEITKFRQGSWEQEANRWYYRPAEGEERLTNHNRLERIAYLPGSRQAEILTLMPIFRKLRKLLPKHEAQVVIPPHFSKEQISKLYGDLEGFKVSNNTHETLYESDFAFVCSGTATLEASLIGTPTVLVYKAKALDHLLIKHLTDLRYAGLANLFSLDFQQRPMHPELLQDALSPSNLFEAYKELDRSRFAEDSQRLRNYLGGGSAAKVSSILIS